MNNGNMDRKATIEANARNFTDYRPICEVNNLIKNKAGINNNHDYRLYLQRNAEKIINMERQNFINNNKIKKCDCHRCIVLNN